MSTFSLRGPRSNSMNLIMPQQIDSESLALNQYKNLQLQLQRMRKKCFILQNKKKKVQTEEQVPFRLDLIRQKIWQQKQQLYKQLSFRKREEQIIRQKNRQKGNEQNKIIREAISKNRMKCLQKKQKINRSLRDKSKMIEQTVGLEKQKQIAQKKRRNLSFKKMELQGHQNLTKKKNQFIKSVLEKKKQSRNNMVEAILSQKKQLEKLQKQAQNYEQDYMNSRVRLSDKTRQTKNKTPATNSALTEEAQ